MNSAIHGPSAWPMNSPTPPPPPHRGQGGGGVPRQPSHPTGHRTLTHTLTGNDRGIPRCLASLPSRTVWPMGVPGKLKWCRLRGWVCNMWGPQSQTHPPDTSAQTTACTTPHQFDPVDEKSSRPEFGCATLGYLREEVKGNNWTETEVIAKTLVLIYIIKNETEDKKNE
jgi:hypothetical protein